MKSFPFEGGEFCWVAGLIQSCDFKHSLFLYVLLASRQSGLKNGGYVKQIFNTESYHFNVCLLFAFGPKAKKNC